ncbi:DUF5682 family protein [Paractinoplanes durhamensis]|uniref:Uncharacterized protein n=1 Tax=Paractinoplanes durhamensis TaxID=113563 RepID=A0ABQ3Z2X4_9ACTN|nr:DUF5682 family protein [Actinoplanes durhamensis]GIE04146.1 hypothetical protein Adu01nite_54960 [Actinoplanes durhamensis]
MPVTFIGVRHHSPACARLVADTIDELRPAYVLIEGPADFNPRLDELLLGHEFPVAIFSSYRDEERRHASWAPLCDYSPEWLALTHARKVGATARFIDLPAWHPAFDGRTNRYADAELRYADVMTRLCRSFEVDNTDALWDHLFELAPAESLTTHLDTYFDLIRGDADPGESDRARESYMASWVAAAEAAAGDRPVVVVTGGFHRPALVAARAARPAVDVAGPSVPAAVDIVWPSVPAMPDGAIGGSFLVPYSFRRLDAFDGYQSGMPSPGYYQELWESGTDGAARHLVEAVATRLRERKQPVSTADLIAAHATADGLATVRGHRHPGRTDVLDGLVSALVKEALDVPLPWSQRGILGAGSHPVVVEMVAALSGTRVGRLHPETPAPPLVHDLDAELSRAGLDGSADLDLDLTREPDRLRSRVLHRVRVLGLPGFRRDAGPTTGLDPILRERWTLRPTAERLPAVIEAGAYGATLADAAGAALADRATQAGRDVDALATVLFDAALAGITDISSRTLADIEASVGSAPELGPLGRMLAVVLTMWRHDHLFGTAHSATLGTVIEASVRRVMWLAEGIRGGDAPADPARIAALAACRDALHHAGRRLTLDREAALETATRLATDDEVPPDLRGAAFGFRWALLPTPPSPTEPTAAASAGHPAQPPNATSPVDVAASAQFAVPADAAAPAETLAAPAAPAEPPAPPVDAVAATSAPAGSAAPEVSAESGGRGGLGVPAGAVSAPGAFDPVRAVRGAFVPRSAGDWLAGLFALAREEVLQHPEIVGLLDELMSGMAADDFLVALPALRQAFAYFPPREREAIAGRLLARRGIGGTGRLLLRGGGDPAVVAAGMALDELVDAVLRREGLIGGRRD